MPTRLKKSEIPNLGKTSIYENDIWDMSTGRQKDKMLLLPAECLADTLFAEAINILPSIYVVGQTPRGESYVVVPWSRQKGLRESGISLQNLPDNVLADAWQASEGAIRIHGIVEAERQSQIAFASSAADTARSGCPKGVIRFYRYHVDAEHKHLLDSSIDVQHRFTTFCRCLGLRLLERVDNLTTATVEVLLKREPKEWIEKLKLRIAGQDGLQSLQNGVLWFLCEHAKRRLNDASLRVWLDTKEGRSEEKQITETLCKSERWDEMALCLSALYYIQVLRSTDTHDEPAHGSHFCDFVCHLKGYHLEGHQPGSRAMWEHSNRASDSRRARLRRLDDSIGDAGPRQKPAAVSAWPMATALGPPCSRGARARRASCEGSDSPDTQRVAALASDPAGHAIFKAFGSAWQTAKDSVRPPEQDEARFNKWSF
ncbi:hypothetical protein B0T26DRAFT_673049 [Lasiosphaeria miniovina]|uniref:Uncharacterized protein n=1 Tax=Lasiosphaeria miniovina TaxID=1954250 RepID=A0AA40B6C0_9PEZI|nr:uncharacterized protein B0T26DRAFT_673049 [Lasiosphaeria miniovina]KAK0728536.1 hypothetical protein B0T26DRAFT_673049 [Lasiosphaeria miniovina]